MGGKRTVSTSGSVEVFAKIHVGRPSALHFPAMNLDDCRRQIDALDEQLVALLNRRAVLVGEVARVKQKTGLPIRIPAREAEVLAKVAAANRGPLDDEALHRLFTAIIQESRRLEHRMLGTSETADDDPSVNAS